jgi:predicted PurR-regulated permease PerM
MVGFYFLKAPYPPMLGVITFVTNMIPYFGPILGAIPIVGLTLLATDMYRALWALIFYVVLQQIEGNFLGPKILGGSIGVSPFWVIFAILIGGGLFGVWGMILGVPALAGARLLMQEYLYGNKRQ